MKGDFKMARKKWFVLKAKGTGIEDVIVIEKMYGVAALDQFLYWIAQFQDIKGVEIEIYDKDGEMAYRYKNGKVEVHDGLITF